MSAGIIKESFKAINYYLDAAQKRRAGLMFILIFSSTFLDIFGLASIVPVIIAASEKGYIYRNTYFKYVYDLFGFTSERSFLVSAILVILLIFILKSIYLVAVNFKQARFIASIGLKNTEKQFNKYTNIPYLEFTRVGTAWVINQVLTTPMQFSTSIIRQMFALLTEFLNTILILVALLIFNPILVLLIGVILGPGSYFMYYFIRKQSAHIGREINEKRPVAHMLVTDTFTGYIEMKLANKQLFFRKKLMNNQRRIQELTELHYLFTLLPGKGMEVLGIFGIVLIFLYAMYIPNSGSIIAIIGLFAAAAYRLMPTAQKLLQALLNLKNNQYVLENLRLYRDYESEGRFTSSAAEAVTFNHSITLKNISFSFPTANVPALEDISLTIKKGERIGFIGASGSGKSTLMSVILQFYPQQNGEILIDDILLKEMNVPSWHSKIGYVKQDVFIMNGTIRDNITLGEEQVDEERFDRAIKNSSLSDFIQQLPEGVNTVVVERGLNLSGGQRQRLGIARALYRQSELLILDEATSALDNETEREVSEAIENLSQTDITILIVAHRITTLRGCNRIYKLDAGKIEGIYNYEDVLQEVIK